MKKSKPSVNPRCWITVKEIKVNKRILRALQWRAAHEEGGINNQIKVSGCQLQQAVFTNTSEQAISPFRGIFPNDIANLGHGRWLETIGPTHFTRIGWDSYRGNPETVSIL